VSAHDGICTLLQRYARAVDDRDIDALAGLFDPDAVIVGARGTQSVEEWLESMRAPRSFPVSMHVIGEPLIEAGDGSARATADTYAVVYQLGDDGSGLTLGMRYLDEVAWRDDRWVFVSRRSVVVWMR
jgi:ketosteroid isomerase-like protein